MKSCVATAPTRRLDQDGQATMTAPDTDEVDRLRLAIQALEAQRDALGDAVVTASVAALRKQIAELETLATAVTQQRKLATVLFTDVADHTRLVQGLDPEDNLALMDEALVRLAAVIEAHGGRVVRYQGDGFKAVFGLPVARESDPEAAVRAGLGLLAVAHDYAQQVEADWNRSGFALRVGIDTGLVIAGGMTEAQDAVSGLTVNLAARLESAAPAGGLLISHRTYQHVRGVFDVEPQAPIQAKGFPEPVPVYLVRRAKTRAFRQGRRGLENLDTALIGRDRELKSLQDAFWRAIGRRQTTMVTIVGEAGVGKSRLVYEFIDWLALLPENAWTIGGRATPQTRTTPQYLLRDLLGRAFQIRDSDSLADVRARFTAAIGEFLLDDAEMKAHVLGAWLGYDFRGSPHLAPLRDEPEQLKNRASLYLAQLLAAVVTHNPTVVMLDDVHWADGSSLDTVTDLLGRRPDLPLLVIALARPSLYERRPDWDEKSPNHARLDVEPLSGADTRALVAEILRLVDAPPAALLELVSRRAEGNPFYAEELVRMLIDDGVIETGPDAWRVAPDRLPALRVPATLTGVLQARLDRLPSLQRQAAQQASVIGHVFWDRALVSLAPEASAALPGLQVREFIFPRAESAFAGTTEFAFKHALLRDVTYETVLKRLRRQYHNLVADWLAATAEANGRGAEYAGVIGEHYQLAGHAEQAAHWYGRAGRQAAGAFAHEDAVRFLSLALAFTPEAATATRFELLADRERAYASQGQREAQRTDLDRLAQLAADLGEEAEARVALRQADYAYSISDYDDAVTHAETAVARATALRAPGMAAEGYWTWGNALWRQGRIAQAQDRLETGLRLAERAEDLKQVANCLNGLGKVARVRGDLEAAADYYRRSLAIRRQSGDRHGESVNLNNLGLVASYQGDFSTARSYVEQSLAIDRAVGDRWGEGMGQGNLGGMAFYQGDFAAAEVHYRQALEIQRQIGDRRGAASNLNNLGAVAANRGAPAEARDYLEQALDIQRTIGDRWGEGISLNELGALALAQGDLALAGRCYERALGIRQAMGQTQYLVEDWAGLARLSLERGDRKAAGRLAHQVLTYLDDNPDLKGAENPMRAFRQTWETLMALEDRAGATAVLARATAVMQVYLEQNRDPALQAMYLRQPHHRRLWEARERQRDDYTTGPGQTGPGQTRPAKPDLPKRTCQTGPAKPDLPNRTCQTGPAKPGQANVWPGTGLAVQANGQDTLATARV